MSTGIAQRNISDTPIAVIDFETTGLTPGFDRVVEVSVVRIDPGEKARIAFDTLINPHRPMAATEIHGITDSDVSNAPRFSDIAGEILAATKDCVIAAYNVYFDIKFLNFELSNSGIDHSPPHFCLMYMRPMLGLGSRCKLEVACQLHGIDYEATHVAADDAMAAGKLFEEYRTELGRRGVGTFQELADLHYYKFAESFCYPPFPDPAAFGLNRFDGVLSRAGFAKMVDPVRKAFSDYWDGLKNVLADLEISEEELAFMKAEAERGGLKPEQIRVLHARAFASVVAQFASDQWIDDRESRKIQKLHKCLETLGWAPGG